MNERTDPNRVKARYDRVEVHDHRDGVCELLADPDREAQTGCHLEPDWHAKQNRCPRSCPVCGGWSWKNRKARHEKRREIMEQLYGL